MRDRPELDPAPHPRARWVKVRSSAALVIVGGIFILPLLALLIAPLREPGLPPSRGFAFLADGVSFRSFRDAFTSVPLARSIVNSIVVVSFAVPLTLITASAAALGITIAGERFRRVATIVLLIAAVIPITAVWIPRFALFTALGLTGTYVPLIAPAFMGGSPLFVLLYFVSFRRIPLELFEAARMEGTGPIRMWWRVALPLVRPTTAAIAMLAIVSFWSNFIDPLLYLRSEKDLTSPLMLHHLELLGPTNWPVFLAAALVITLPVILAFAVAQRFLWSGERGAGWLGR